MKGRKADAASVQDKSESKAEKPILFLDPDVI